VPEVQQRFPIEAGYWSSLVADFELAITAQGLKAHTVANYTRDVSRFATHLSGIPVGQVSTNDVRGFLADFAMSRSAKTVHETQLGLRRFFRFLVGEGKISDDPTRDVKTVRYEVRPQPTYTSDEVRQLLSGCDLSTRFGVRDFAMVTVLYDTGVRTSELVSMNLPDRKRRRVRVDGKTGVRIAPLGKASLQAIDNYVDRWNIGDGNLWRGKQGPLTGSGVFQLIRRLCNAAGVPDKGVHAFRRAAAAQMKRLGMQDSDILEVMGWKDVIMLRRYTAIVATELAGAAHAKFSPGDSIYR
jgi:site-specific recombinase XerD